jgi:fatty-acyl-CoA synthase
LSPPKTIPQALFATAERRAGTYVFHLEDGVVELSCEELAERASHGAGRLSALGVEPGDAVGVLGPNRPEWVVWAFATWIVGAVLVPIQRPLRVRDRTAFVERLRMLVDAARCRVVLADPALASHLPDRVAVPWGEEGEGSGHAPAPPAPGDAAVIQFSSGSTAAPKGARLTHAAVLAQMEILRHAYRHPGGAPRVVANWTPFFHDLGLFANLVHPAFASATIHQLPTERFAADPLEWLRLVAASRATITVAPPSAFGNAVAVAARRGERPDLSSLDAALFATETVDPAIARRMVESAPAFGLRETALGSTYGQAEAVMAVAYSRTGSGLRVDGVSLRELANAGRARPAGDGPERRLVSCGEPLTELRIVGVGEPLQERRVGEIQVRGESVMSGYVGADAPDPFDQGWLRTGDLGYLADGELYVTGRDRDMVIVLGGNYYPEDFEWAASRVPGVRPGRCVAFNLPGTEEVVVLVEPTDGAAPEPLRREVRRAIADAVGVAPSDVVVLPPGTVQKTTSGKLRRASMREAYADGALAATSR